MSISLLLESAASQIENHGTANGDGSATLEDPEAQIAASPAAAKPTASRASSRISARRSKAAAEAERRAAAAAVAAVEAPALTGAVPLWRELRAASEEARRRGDAGARDREAKLAKQQCILRHIAWTRLAQDLPPVFAILRGPTIRPYRMEELSLTLGRITAHHRDVELALDSRNVKISRVHARIVYDRGQGCYCIVNLSKNGVKVKQGDKFVSYMTIGEPIPLPNPATIDIQGTLIYLQAFFISSSSSGQYTANGDSDDKKKGGKATAGAKRKRGQGVTYSEMIQSALRALGGAATQPKITRYIQEHFKEDIAGRTTWRNSVSGVLSANPLFIQEAIISEGGRKDRKSLWRLKGFPLSAAAAAAVTGEREEEADEEEDESALVVDDEADEEEEEAEEDADEAERPDKRARGIEEENEEEEGEEEE